MGSLYCAGIEVVWIMQVLKDEIRHKILLEAELLFLQKGYDRTTLQMIADKVNISKSNFYHYFRSKEEMFYVLTDGAADGPTILRPLTCARTMLT